MNEKVLFELINSMEKLSYDFFKTHGVDDGTEDQLQLLLTIICKKTIDKGLEKYIKDTLHKAIQENNGLAIQNILEKHAHPIPDFIRDHFEIEHEE